MKNSNTTVEVYPHACNIAQVVGKRKACNTYHSTSSYGVVTTFTDNNIRIVDPFHFSAADQSATNDLGFSKLIYSNIENEFKKLRAERVKK